MADIPTADHLSALEPCEIASSWLTKGADIVGVCWRFDLASVEF